MTIARRPVLILGAGINGSAIARELLLNDVPVVVVDTGDIASGATAYSSRLIHGGLRYLEYGDTALVRESLEERARLLQHAPQFVRPLRLYIPTRTRWGGLLGAAGRFFGLPLRSNAPYVPRGAWLVRMGLWLYDRYARDPGLPPRSSHRLSEPAVPQVNQDAYRYLSAYSDAQVLYPERLVLAFLEDARRLATSSCARWEVYNHHRAHLDGTTVTIRPVDQDQVDQDQVVATLQPCAVVNATGAWIDGTLARLNVSSRRLIGGTQGTHLLTYNQRVRQSLGGSGIYVEAVDGRPIFLLPLGPATMVGTTDLPFFGDPAEARSSETEIAYLLDMVNQVLPGQSLSRNDVDLHYCGVRPLPFVESDSPASVSRRHQLERNDQAEVPVYSVIGGKLTTCRSLAEQTVTRLSQDLNWEGTRNSRARAIPGSENYPTEEALLEQGWQRLADQHSLPPESVAAVWSLFGTRTDEILDAAVALADGDGRQLLPGTPLPCCIARWCVRHEWGGRLDDLILRRLMLLYHPALSRACLNSLAGMLVEEGKLAADRSEAEVTAVVDLLRDRFGKRLIG